MHSSAAITCFGRLLPLSVCESLQQSAKVLQLQWGSRTHCRFLINAGGSVLLTEQESPWLPWTDTQGRDNSGTSFSCHQSCDGLMKRRSLTAVMRHHVTVFVCMHMSIFTKNIKRQESLGIFEPAEPFLSFYNCIYSFWKIYLMLLSLAVASHYHIEKLRHTFEVALLFLLLIGIRWTA